MLNSDFFDSLARQLSALLPPSLHSLRTELEHNFRDTLQIVFSKLNLVTREEFEVQARLLEKASKRIAALEQKINPNIS
jgi:ubiquinone biosynthesis accessory factor UbiK